LDFFEEALEKKKYFTDLVVRYLIDGQRTLKMKVELR